jgi:mannosyltransferase PIG-V
LTGALPQRLRAALGDPGRVRAARTAFGAFVLSRGIVAFVAILASRNVSPPESQHDVPHLAHPFGEWSLGGLLDALLSPLARWDAVWYLQISQDGYAGGEPLPSDERAVFFPLYPLAIRAVAGFTGSAGASLIAAYVVSLAAFLAALYLFYRLVELELGSEIARVAVLLLALSPWTMFFGAPYSESLFLLLTVGAFYAARTGRWAWAGVLGAAAAATRNTGIVLLLPLVLLYLYPPDGHRLPGVRRGFARLRPTVRIRADAALLVLVPVGLALVCVHMANVYGDPFVWRDVQQAASFGRSLDGPIVGLIDAVEAGWIGLRDLVTGDGGTDGLQRNTLALAVLAAAGAGAVWLFRALHPAYAVYVVAALIPPLSAPDDYTPLLSLPRFATVLFPLFMCLAAVCVRRRAVEPAIACSAALAGLFTFQFATWQGNAN